MSGTIITITITVPDSDPADFAGRTDSEGISDLLYGIGDGQVVADLQVEVAEAGLPEQPEQPKQPRSSLRSAWMAGYDDCMEGSDIAERRVYSNFAELQDEYNHGFNSAIADMNV